MIITWLKSDGSKFMAKLDDTMEGTLMNFLIVNKAQALTEEEIKIHNHVKIIEHSSTTANPPDPQAKKRWWRI